MKTKRSASTRIASPSAPVLVQTRVPAELHAWLAAKAATDGETIALVIRRQLLRWKRESEGRDNGGKEN